MLKPIFTIFDQKTREYLHPFMAANEDTAKREFYNTLAQVPTMSQHPNDYALYYTGSFNTESGELGSSPTVQFIITGLDCIDLIKNESANVQTQVSNDPSIQPST